MSELFSTFDLKDKKTYDAVGCEHCSNIGYKDRVAIFEVLKINDEIKELISNDESPIKIKREALKYGYEPLDETLNGNGRPYITEKTMTTKQKLLRFFGFFNEFQIQTEI